MQKSVYTAKYYNMKLRKHFTHSSAQMNKYIGIKKEIKDLCTENYKH